MPLSTRKRLAFIITGLSTGGAEMMLYKLLSRLNLNRFDPVVISLADRGILGHQVEALGIPVYTIGVKSEMPSIAVIWRLINTVQKLQPDLIQGWMAHGNLAAQLVSIFIPRQVPVIWNIRHSALAKSDTKAMTLLIIKVLSYLSHLPARIISNCQTGLEDHHKIGYCADKTTVIPNGFDTEIFAPSAEARFSIRSNLNCTENTLLIGLVGRFHPMKDHATFLQAAALLSKRYPDVQFVLIGNKVDCKNQLLCELIQNLNLGDRVHLLGLCYDLPRINAGLDIATSSSAYGEGFPNVIGEAMSCGVPCVVTDVGDSAWIVGNTGRVVPPRNPESLNKAWQQLIELGSEGRAALGQAARTRVIENFSLDSVVAQYQALYESMVGKQLN
ncbi:glycosyltransferase [Coleofasciculus sp. FACHB-712]|uniref:glycosyltransferase family 4 protein n=1 Tax=Coleofasciculus sp. FACHB-712 TaxID=2692789 RepID=UPI0016841C03|nr:glycosyltransferase [Coleofasciculus sp. FACHB-712]MBD1945815.1 glycosyltransferase [Coleofasciculus sp. FACHB-712]